MKQKRRIVKPMPSKQQNPEKIAEIASNISLLLGNKQFEQAEKLLHNSLSQFGEQAELRFLLARSAQVQGRHDGAVEQLKLALESDGNHTASLSMLTTLLYKSSNYKEALNYAKQALISAPNNLNILEQKALILSELRRYDEAADIFDILVKKRPNDPSFWNNAGNVWRNLGQLDKAAAYYKKAMEFATEDNMAYSNYLTALHYQPEYTAEQIYLATQEWEQRYSGKISPYTIYPNIRNPGKRLRIGMFSDGFRTHPVGQMITSALEQLPEHELELYLYSTNSANDPITRRIKKTADKWMSIIHLNDEEFACQVREDGIDILIDLCGHNSGSRVRTMVQKPAPIGVKWVGGLINTTGVSAIDYLLSDTIETPLGVDHLYTEKLIRLPDDYICYNPPIYTPNITQPPAKYTGHITLGCFNNPTKINEVLLKQWARILHTLPNARLFLKGLQFGSELLRQQVRNYLEKTDIAPHRIMIEGPSPHDDLLKAYNRVDIALDTWPYSGGLTTCEALYMGVPVVTLPGPTFAGRHSATHLTNVGLPQLVADDWDQYHDIAVALANDLDNLVHIRAHLRNALLESPLCDAKRFARNFSNAMRAIWQRYCEAKAPAGLTLNKEGHAYFEDQTEAVRLQLPIQSEPTEEKEFHFRLNEKIMVLDNGAVLSSSVGFVNLYNMGVFITICLDPGNKISNTQQLQQSGNFHYVPMTTLGNGEQITLNITQEPAYCSTLPLLPSEQLPEQAGIHYQSIAEIPINTVRLDDISGIDGLEWLALDNMHDYEPILQHGANALKQLLLVQIRVNFTTTHQRQPELEQCQRIMADLGYRFHKLSNLVSLDEASAEASNPLFADAIFVPGDSRLSSLDNNQRLKLAFLLHALYQSFELSHKLLLDTDPQLAEDYLDSLSPEEKIAASFIIPREVDLTEQRATRDEVPPVSPVKPDWSTLHTLKTGRYTHAASRVCIGIPIYNEAAYLAETLTSLRRQNIDDAHFLIIDNASTDNSVELCLELIGNDERFTLLQQHANLGAMRNFEAAYTLSESEYFMWLGGHDYLSDNYLASAIATLQTSPQIAMVMGQPHAVLNGQHYGLVKEALYDFSSNNPLERYLTSIAGLGNCTIVHSLFRRRALQHHALRKTISADHVLISHLLWQGKLHYLEDVCYYRRYFQQRDSTQSERISGNKEYLSRYDFYRFYLDDFARLYEGDERMRRYLEHKILNELEQRFGTRGLLENDGLHLH